MSKNILIIGFGNVGKAIGKIEEEAGNKVYILERGSMPEKVDYDVCHITIPNSNEYVKIITDYLREYIPELVIIHTTIIFDILRKIKQITGMKIVYAPVNSPNNSNEEVVYQDKKEKPIHIVGYNTDIRYSKEHLEDILSNKIIYSTNTIRDYPYRRNKVKPVKEVKLKYVNRNDEALEAIRRKLTEPHKKIGKYY